MPDGLRRALFVWVGVFCLFPWVSPGLALAIGVAFALTLQNPWPKDAPKLQKYLLQACVVLLGFSMDLHKVLEAGLRGVLLAAGSITITLLAGWGLGRALGVAQVPSVLISVGTAICGGSAIAAVGSVLGAASTEMTVAIGTVFVLNAIALYVFPPLGHLLHLTPNEFGVWAGIAIHDVSSVVGAASAYSDDSLEVATAVKLSRALWIVPLTIGAAAWLRRPDQGKAQPPWFIGLFLVASAVSSFVPALAPVQPWVVAIAKAGMRGVLFLIGASLSMQTMRTVGWRPMAQGAILWVGITALALCIAWYSAV
jgi:uncharacterized integral membrane protein (TIGR00698 family)